MIICVKSVLCQVVRSFFDDVKIHDKFQFVVVCLLAGEKLKVLSQLSYTTSCDNDEI